MDASSAPSGSASRGAFPVTDGGRDTSVRIVLRDVGALQILLSLVMLLPLLVSVIYGEVYNALSFLAASGVTAAFGALAYRTCRDAGEAKRYHAMIIAGAGWFVTALFGALPFVFAAYWTPPDVAHAFVPAGAGYASSLIHFRNPLHAFFESMSAYTTTGLTMAVHEPSIGKGLLFYRSVAQWVGGAGVIVLSLAIIPRPHVIAELELYQSETSGTKLRPSVLGTARAIWKVYSVLTLLVALFLFGMTRICLPEYGVAASLFDAVNHAMTGLATGGFSTLDDSIAGYRSYGMELAHLPPMILGAISIPLYYTFLRTRDLRVFWRDPQFRAMLAVFAVLIPLLIAMLRGSAAVADPIREGLFQAVSGVSGTGWQTSAVGDWPRAGAILLAGGGMIVSGAAGSTVGGIKLIRAYILFRAVTWRIRGIFLPSDAVVPFRVGDRNLGTNTMQREIADAAVFSLLYLFVLGGAVLLAARQVGPEFTLADVIFECVSAQSTVGLSTGITEPGMPVTVEILFVFQMWVGRLEIFPVIILFSTLFSWKRRR